MVGVFVGNEHNVYACECVLCSRKIPRISENGEVVCFDEEATVAEFFEGHGSYFNI
jgi:hypothetical protein